MVIIDIISTEAKTHYPNNLLNVEIKYTLHSEVMLFINLPILFLDIDTILHYLRVATDKIY